MTWKPRPNVRLELSPLEAREVPLDLWGVLRGGLALGGVPLLGVLDTPLTALFRQDTPLPAGPTIGAGSELARTPTTPEGGGATDTSAVREIHPAFVGPCGLEQRGRRA